MCICMKGLPLTEYTAYAQWWNPCGCQNYSGPWISIDGAQVQTVWYILVMEEG